MSLSSGGWTHTPGPGPGPGPGSGFTPPDQPSSSSALPADLHHGASPPPAPEPGCNTVLISVRVSVCHSGIRPLCLPGAGDESLRLQLSMDPGKSGEFRLTLQDSSDTGRSVTVAEFDLRSVNYEIKSTKCHELYSTTPPHERISFNFRCEQEAHEWATVLMSSLREAHRVAPEDSGQHFPLDALQQQNTLTLQRTEETCMDLTRAIEAGDAQAASLTAAKLAKQHAALRIQPSPLDYEDSEINLTVVVEDSSSSCCVTVKVFPHMTTAALKQQMFLEYGFHPQVQRWVIGQCLCGNQRSLASYGVRRDGDTAFLYLLSARHARLTLQVLQQDQESALLLNPPALPPAALPGRPAASNGPSPPDQRPYTTLPPRLHSSGAERGNVSEIKDLINLEMSQLSEALGPSTTSTQGWSCPSCTFINKPTRPGCEICSTNRPESYVVPGGYRPDALELRRIEQEKEAIKQYQQEKGRREVLRCAQNNSILFNLDQDY